MYVTDGSEISANGGLPQTRTNAGLNRPPTDEEGSEDDSPF
jgi:hypothetical protein